MIDIRHGQALVAKRMDGIEYLRSENIVSFLIAARSITNINPVCLGKRGHELHVQSTMDKSNS
jgi:hypothetical protein